VGQSLERLKVVDFSRVLAGPFSTMLLGDLGAEVCKIERRGGGDDTRSWGPPWDDTGVATYFLSVNRNKRSMAADLNDAVDLAQIKALCGDADVIVENFRPGVMEQFGLDYSTLAEVNPRLIFCSITGFGSAKGAGLAGYDLLVQAVGGLMSITGSAEGEPQKVGVALVDVLSGLYATVGILAALQYRERSGLGQLVEVNLLSSLLASLANQGSAYTAAGAVAQRMGNAHPSIAPYDLFPARDGDLVLAVGNDRQFARFCAVVGNPSLASDARYVTNADRVENRISLRETILPLLAERTPDQWVAALNPVGVPAGVVNDIAAGFEFAASLGLDPIVELDRGDGSRVALTRNPIGLSLTPPRYHLAPPSLSEDPWSSEHWTSMNHLHVAEGSQ